MNNTYFLRNKNIDCFAFDYDENENKFSNFVKLEGFNFLPPILKNSDLEQFHKYLLFNRMIPISRPNFQNIFSKKIYLEKLFQTNYSLNLDDTLWITPKENSNLKWEDINFFSNFKNLYSNEILSYNKKVKFHNNTLGKSPDFFTNGELQKTWIKRGDEIILLKSNSRFSTNIPLNEIYAEFFANQISKLFFNEILDYDINIYNGVLVNECKIFTNQDTSYLPFSQIFNNKDNNIENFIKNISNLYGKDELDDLMVFDALILNIDRHLGNFGLLVNSETYQKIKNAPIFDNGKSLIYDFNIYKGSIGKNYIKNYAKHASKFYNSFDYQLFEHVQKRHITWIEKLEKFSLKNHAKFPCDKSYFKCVKNLISNRVKAFKIIYENKAKENNW